MLASSIPSHIILFDGACSMLSTVHSAIPGLPAKLTYPPGNTPDAVRNQIFDHSSSVTSSWYLDQEVRCDTQAAFLERTSDVGVQKTARLMTFTADRHAPTKYSDKDLKKIANNSHVRRLSRQREVLTTALRKKYGLVRSAPITDPLVKQKASIVATLHTLKENLRNKHFNRSRKNYFKIADTVALEAYLHGRTNPRSSTGDFSRLAEYNLPERGWIVQLMYDHTADLTDAEKFTRRVSTILHRATLCDRQESRDFAGFRRERSPTRSMSPPKYPDEGFIDPKCHPNQCPFCIGDERKSHKERTRIFTRPSTMRDHVQGHLAKRPSNAPIRCHHPICIKQGLVLETLTIFKNHTQSVHGIELRS